MRMNSVDVDKLVEWLGPEGAIAGLDASDLTASELIEIGNVRGLTIDRKTRRRSIVIEIVNSRIPRIDKSQDDLLRMSRAELEAYFVARMVSRAELLGVLSQFGIEARSDDKKSLLEFAAREISDLGMYQRVAKGNSSR
jgi:hypothetical protein